MAINYIQSLLNYGEQLMKRCSLQVFFLLFAGLVILLLGGCARDEDRGSSAAAGKGLPQVVTTTTMVSDLVGIIGGEDIRLVPLMGAGVDPHLFKMPARSATDLKRADAVVYSGLELEGRIDETFEKMAARGVTVRAVADVVPEDALILPEGAGVHPDPHIWGDVSLWAKAVPLVVDTLSELVPEKAGIFRARGDAYIVELEKLHRWAGERLAEIPEGRRVLVTSHDAFNYFGRAYSVEVVALQGVSTVDEASLAGVTKLVDMVKERGVKAVFVETSVSDGPLRRVAKETGAAVGGVLFSDSMGTPGDIEEAGGESYDLGTYVGMVKHNVNAIVGGLR